MTVHPPTDPLALTLRATATSLGGSAEHREVSIDIAASPVMSATADLLAQYATHVGADAKVLTGPNGPIELMLTGPGNRIACVLDAAALALTPHPRKR